MVKIKIGSKTGAPNWNGGTKPNHAALPTLSKLIMPIAAATTPPITMPKSTEMLLIKPLKNLEIIKIETSTKAAMPILAIGAYLGLGTLPTMAKPFGTAGTVLPAALAAAVTSANHLA